MWISRRLRIFAAPGMLTAIAANLKVGKDATSFCFKVSRAMVDTLGIRGDVLGRSMMPDLVQLIEGDRSGGIIFMYVLYLIISFVIFGTVLMMMEERKFEFGVINAIGMSRRNLEGMIIL
ncbi:MAG: FtsX-like permease family protein [Bacteroidia bacterium]